MSRVLGIDLSSHAIDLVWLNENDNAARWDRLHLRGDTAFDRLRQVPHVMPAASAFDDCYLVAIERPKTRFMPSAAALFPIFGAVLTCLPAETEVWDVAPTQWRHGLGLKGNATKEQCAAAVMTIHGDLPDDFSPAVLEPVVQDALDAYAVAYYARELNARGIAFEQAREKQLVLAPQPEVALGTDLP